ncbi:MAG: helix-turn-helix transcriptional regulator [Saprospiraceae bacterium]|nr:helix-turn-helix transcriptional regulator [Saprospiraceae bacterium]
MEVREFAHGKMALDHWEVEGIRLRHAQVSFNREDVFVGGNDRDTVRLHFGLKGDYDFHARELGTSYSLRGDHNNIMYAEGLQLEIHNRSSHIETFGVEFTKDRFFQIAEKGNEPLKLLADQIAEGKAAILSSHWRPNTLRIKQLISEIIHCDFTEPLRSLFLQAKSIELLVLQADLYAKKLERAYIRRDQDKKKLFDARDILSQRLDGPPTISALSRMVGMNEYKLKKGFKELFDTTIFGFIHQHRMQKARQLLLDTSMSAKEIAYETGYSSPQHFSRAFKKEFNTTPNRMRNTPDNAM